MPCVLGITGVPRPYCMLFPAIAGKLHAAKTKLETSKDTPGMDIDPKNHYF